jgi:peptide/nickel transport system substrate-binding protein
MGVILGGVSAVSQQEGQTIRIVIGIDPDTLDPVRLTTTLMACMVTYTAETLVYQTPEGEFKPLLATDWTVTPNYMEFKIRKGVKFHDGTPLNAEAVKINFDRFMDPEIPCPLCGFIGPLERVEVIDEYTVRIHYKIPFAPALLGLTWPTAAIVSPKVIEEAGKEAVLPVGTGPFILKEWISGEKVVMVRNENYWGKPAIPKELVWLVVPEAGTRSAMVMAGDAEVAYQPPAPDVPMLKAHPNVEVISVPSTRIMFAAMNTAKPPLDNKKVRQALNYAVDAEAIADKIVHGAGSPNHAPIPDFFFGYHEVGFYEYNPDKARKLLAEAGYPDGFELIFYHPTGRYILDAKVSEVIQSYLAEVGVVAKLVTMDWPSYIASLLKPVEESPYDLAFLGWGPLADAHHTLYSMFHSSQHPPVSFNVAFYKNPEVDKLLEEALSEFDIDRRKELYRQAQEIIWEDAPWIFLYTQHMILGVNANLEGLWTYPWEMFSVTYAYIKE